MSSHATNLYVKISVFILSFSLANNIVRDYFSLCFLLSMFGICFWSFWSVSFCFHPCLLLSQTWARTNLIQNLDVADKNITLMLLTSSFIYKLITSIFNY